MVRRIQQSIERGVERRAEEIEAGGFRIAVVGAVLLLPLVIVELFASHGSPATWEYSLLVCGALGILLIVVAAGITARSVFRRERAAGATRRSSAWRAARRLGRFLFDWLP